MTRLNDEDIKKYLESAENMRLVADNFNDFYASSIGKTAKSIAYTNVVIVELLQRIIDQRNMEDKYEQQK